MRRIDFLILLLGIIGSASWVLVSGKDGYKANNATILARSISVTSTIDGQIENETPEVGTLVDANELLVKIQDRRFDRSRLVEFESQIAFLTTEINSLNEQEAKLQIALEIFSQKAEQYSAWLLRDAKLRQKELHAQLDIARKRRSLKTGEVRRAKQLFNKSVSSEVNLETKIIEADIAGREVKLSEAQFERSALKLGSLEKDGVFFDDGDTSYWNKMVDTLNLRHSENIAKMSLLKSQLSKTMIQVEMERKRINSSFMEEHRSPFAGVVNASYVTKGAKVNAGTDMFQILDCTQPVIIIPIPDNRISEFIVGLKVTVYPTDSELALPGKISYVTSGAMLENDASIQIQQDLILRGNRAIVSLNNENIAHNQFQYCEAARKAVVVIHTESTVDKMLSWFSHSFPEIAGWLSENGLVVNHLPIGNENRMTAQVAL